MDADAAPVDHRIVGAPPKAKPDEIDDAQRPSGVRDRETTPAPARAIDSMIASSLAAAHRRRDS